MPVLQRAGNSSQFRGVSLNKASGKWEARIREAGKNHYLGSYNDEATAARAFDAAALSMRGQGATCNFPQDVPGVQARLPLQPAPVCSTDQSLISICPHNLRVRCADKQGKM